MSFVEVTRGGITESRHRVRLCVSDARGTLVASVGDVAAPAFYRSAAKPFQALPLVEEGIVRGLGLTPPELALCCGSHEGTRAHVAVTHSILAKAGVDERSLQCGPHLPYSDSAARALRDSGAGPSPAHNNCSGKHAGMLALAVGMGWDPVDYHRADHPVQRRMLHEVARWSGIPEEEIETAIDGCGIPCFAVGLGAMATSFAHFAAAAAHGECPAHIVEAMTAHPLMVGGEGRACTDVMESTGGRVFVKLGAEGVYGGGIPGRELGFAIKVEDGGRRAVEVALVHLLVELGVLRPSEVAALKAHGRPEVRNTRGEVVGEIRPAFFLEGVSRRTPSSPAPTLVREP
ncbi:MAG: asparaginase [Gemmatimonadota bacterium]|nr:asparaginase [Gemmatimonadota bacterium]